MYDMFLVKRQNRYIIKLDGPAKLLYDFIPSRFTIFSSKEWDLALAGKRPRMVGAPVSSVAQIIAASD